MFSTYKFISTTASVRAQPGMFLPPKTAPSHGGSGLPSNAWFPQVLNPNSISITTVTDQQTDRPCNSICSNRPHLRT